MRGRRAEIPDVRLHAMDTFDALRRVIATATAP
jgi:hypothetical protein